MTSRVGALGFGGVAIDQVVPAIVLLMTLVVMLFGCGLLASTLAFRGGLAMAAVLVPLLVVEAGPRAASWAAANLRLPLDLRLVLQWVAGRRDWSVGETTNDLLNVATTSGWWPPLSTWHLGIGLTAAAVAVVVAEPWLQRTFRFEPKVPRPAGIGRGSRRLTGDAIVAREFRFEIGGARGLLVRMGLHLTLVLIVAAMLYRTDWYELSDRNRLELIFSTPIMAGLLDLWIRGGRLLARESIDRTLAPIVLTGTAMPSLIVRKLVASLTVLLPAAVVLLGLAAWHGGGVALDALGIRPGLSDRTELFLFGFVQVQTLCLAQVTMAVSLRRPLQSFAIGLGVGCILLVVVLGVACVGAAFLTIGDDVSTRFERYVSMICLYLSLIELIGLHLWTIHEAHAVAGE